MVACAAAFVVSYPVLAHLHKTFGLTIGKGLFLIGTGASQGVLLGAAQWILLRRVRLKATRWILATTVGAAIGEVVGSIALSPASGLSDILIARALTGTLVGTLQWLVLRRWLAQASWWVLAGAVGWSAGWLASYSVLVGGSTLAILAARAALGVVVGLPTAACLLWLLGRPVAKPAAVLTAPPSPGANKKRVRIFVAVVLIVLLLFAYQWYVRP